MLNSGESKKEALGVDHRVPTHSAEEAARAFTRRRDVARSPLLQETVTRSLRSALAALERRVSAEP